MGRPRSPPMSTTKGPYDLPDSIPRPNQTRPHPLRTSVSDSRPISNIFSDEFALEPLSGQVSPASSGRTSTATRSPVQDDRPPHISPFADSSEMLPHGGLDSPSPEPGQRQPTQDNASLARASSSASSMGDGSAPSVANRSISTSSRFSVPRAMSPYRGQTGPSHPYAMYPQGISVARSSSVSTTSTVRPVDRAPVNAQSPQHPYAMYSQNTVPEEAMDEQPAPPNPAIPLGFPANDTLYRNNPRHTADEVGDIVGPDGHTEQLPPYTRYPDGLPPPKPEPTQEQGLEAALSPRPPDGTPVSPESGVSSRTLLSDQEAAAAANRNEPSGEDDASGGLKERLAKKGQRRVCCGLPIWVFIVGGVVLLLGTVTSGVIGGLLGSQQGAKDARASDTRESEEPKATVTVTASTTLDATPLSTDPGPLPPAPTGDYILPTNTLSDESDSCISGKNSKVWQCRNVGALAYEILRSDGTTNISFNSFDLPGQFFYGAQRPVLPSTMFPLELMQDQTKMELGPALFFFTPFDKLVVIPESEFPRLATRRRSIDASDLLNHAATQKQDRIAQAGDQPWFCWWNTTYLETFIYVNETSISSSNSNHTGKSGGKPSTTMALQPSSTGVVDETVSLAQYLPVKEPSSSPYYPLSVKFEEKRFAQSNSPPYCEQRQVMDNGSIGDVIGESITIIEADTASGPDVSTSTGENNLKRAERESKCFCQWFNP